MVLRDNGASYGGRKELFVSGHYRARHCSFYYRIDSDVKISDNDLQLYSVNGTQDEHKITLPGNAISKARVYIWLEGQDPDCQDTASTGKSFDLQINLSKPAVT